MSFEDLSWDDEYTGEEPNTRKIMTCTLQPWRCAQLQVHTFCTPLLVFGETFAQNSFAVASCSVPGLSEFYSPVCFDLVVINLGCRIWKVVIDKTFAQSRRLFLQLWPTLFQGWEVFTPLLFRSGNPGCALFQGHTYWVRLLYSRRLSCTLFLQLILLGCAVFGLIVFYSLVLTCSLIFL